MGYTYIGGSICETSVQAWQSLIGIYPILIITNQSSRLVSRVSIISAKTILSFQDWMMNVYCGSTPNGEYAGASIVSRTSRSTDFIHKVVEETFKQVARAYSFTYEEMCISDTTSCPDQPSSR